MFGAFVVALSFAASVFAKSVSVSNCTVSFLAIGAPVVVKIAGKTADGCTANVVGANFAGSTFTVKLDNIDTGISLRNKHLKENYLEVSKYPDSKLELKQVEKADSLVSGESGEGQFTGALTLHGTTQDVSGSYLFGASQVTAKFKILLQDFSIDPPAFMGVKVANEVEMTITFDYGIGG